MVPPSKKSPVPTRQRPAKEEVSRGQSIYFARYDTCSSCLEKPVEGPVRPVLHLGDDLVGDP
jgi:hypothetical protein